MSTAARDWRLWSSECRLVVTDEALLGPAGTLVDEELDRVERACSRFRDDSELMLLPLDGGAVEVGAVLADLLGVALAAARATDGALDPTLGSVLVGLGYDADLAEVRARVAGTPVSVVRRPAGWRRLHLDGSTLTLPPGTRLDLGATAKARAADRCAALVHARLGAGVLVSLGGDVATAGEAPDGGWQVAVQDLPTAVQDLPTDPPHQVALSPGAAVATSSTVRRTWTQGGEQRHHVLDPTTLRPATGPWRTVTVVAPTCVRANVASTTALVRGDGALAWLRSTGLPARLLSHEGSVLTLGGWPREAAVA